MSADAVNGFLLTGEQLRAIAERAGERNLIQVSEHEREHPHRFALCDVWITPLGGDTSLITPDGVGHAR